MTNEQMQAEIVDIADALRAWMVSQEIPPGMGIAAMCQLIAAMCVVQGDAMDMADSANRAITGLTMLGLMRREER